MNGNRACFSIEHISVPWKEIRGIHPDVARISQLTITLWKVSASSLATIGQDRLHELHINAPITCVNYRSKLYVIGGFRTWAITKEYFRAHEKPKKVPVLLIHSRMNCRKRQEFAFFSILMPMLAFGLQSSEAIGALWCELEEIAPDLFHNFFKRRKGTKSRLPRELGASFSSFYPEGDTDE